MREEVNYLIEKRKLARVLMDALSGDTAVDEALWQGFDSGALSKGQDPSRLWLGGLYPRGSGDSEDVQELLHLKYLCRAVNNLNRLSEGFSKLAEDEGRRLVGADGSIGLMDLSSIEDVKKTFGSAWDFDAEWATLRGDTHPTVGKATRTVRAGILIELGRLIVQADADTMSKFRSVGTAEWAEENMLEEIVTGTVDHALNFIYDWLDKRYLFAVVGECLAKIVQIYGWQLLDHLRWEGDLGRAEASKQVFADAAFLEQRFEGLMGDASMWPKIKTYVLTPLEQVGHLMAGGAEGWMAKAVEHLDMYDAGKAARSQPKWVPDEHSVACMLCRSEFGLFLSRHHCRYCGWVGEYSHTIPATST